MTPYIGITGFTTADQVEQVFQALNPPSGRKFMVDVLTGDKRIIRNTMVLTKKLSHPKKKKLLIPDTPDQRAETLQLCVKRIG